MVLFAKDIRNGIVYLQPVSSLVPYDAASLLPKISQLPALQQGLAQSGVETTPSQLEGTLAKQSSSSYSTMILEDIYNMLVNLII
jgi:hypothetical protein